MNAIRPWLYIGKYRETRDRSLLAAYHIDAMLQLSAPVAHPTIMSRYLAVEDGEPLRDEYLRAGVDFIRAAHERQQTILVACGAGMSRAPTFTIAALKELEGLDLLTAARVVKQLHPDALPHMVLWDSLCRYYHEDIPFLDLLHEFER